MRFVIQKHFARKLHYDLRLEIKGKLKSWAVPKQPDNEKGIKRLAIQTEDHDLDYLDFEGDIPEGYYGAGKVEIWDKGEYELEETDNKKLTLEKSISLCGKADTFPHKKKIVFNLKGKKLKGKFCLLKFEKTGKDNWLFFKI